MRAAPEGMGGHTGPPARETGFFNSPSPVGIDPAFARMADVGDSRYSPRPGPAPTVAWRGLRAGAFSGRVKRETGSEDEAKR